MSPGTLVMLTVAGLTLPVLLPGQQTPATPVGQVQNLAHAVDSLEKTVPFYRDVIGLPVGASDPLAARPAVLNEDMSNVTGTQRAKFRAAVLRIPNAPFNLELTEFTGTTRKNFLPNLQDPGVATLVLQIRDLDQMFAKLRAANAAIVTAGGAPVKVSDNPNIKIRGLVVRDPDGLFIQLIQPDPLPASAANTADMVLGGSVNLSIDDAARTVTFLRDAIGFDAHPTAQLGTSAAATTLINLPGAQWRITHGSIAGTALDFGLIEYVGVPRAKAAPAAADPGSPAVTMVVQDIDAAVDRWKKAGGTVVSTGGKAVKLPNGAGNVFLRDINGLLWEFSVKEVLR